MVVGPDSKIYVADPLFGSIFRTDQTGANFETVYFYDYCSEADNSVCPDSPQNPIFSGSAAEDLYFSDPGGDYYEADSQNSQCQGIAAGEFWASDNDCLAFVH